MSKPLAFGNRLLARWRNSPLWPRRTVTRRIGNVALEVDLEPDSIGFKVYFGRYQPDIVKAFRSLLQPGDIVFDVGANIGYLSAIAADAVGPTGQVHCFEPAPSNVRKLRRLAEINPSYSIAVNQVAVGERTGSATILVSLTNIDSHTMIPRLSNPDDSVAVTQVPIITLDDYIRQTALSRLSLVKIDVEGFEFPVLRGLRRFLEAGHRPAIITEVTPAAYPLLGHTLAEMAQFMTEFGYSAFLPDAIGKVAIDVTSLPGVTDVVFLPRVAQNRPRDTGNP